MRRALAPLCLALTGCALLTKADVVATRHFSLESLAAASAPATPTPPSSGPTPRLLRLGRVTGPAFLEARPAWRRGTWEVALREDLRWTEPPTDVLRRHLARALFEARGLTQTLARDGETLEVELIAFEAVPSPPAHVRVAVGARVVGAQGMLWSATLAAEHAYDPKTGGDEAAAQVGALAAVLDLIVEDIANHAVQALEANSTRTSVP
jgi:ABC-type uncharacterized transport system auxiliary subunit